MTPSPTTHLDDIDREFHPDTVLKELEVSTLNYVGAALRLASLQAAPYSRAYYQAFDAWEDRVEEQVWAQGMEQLVMRN